MKILLVAPQSLDTVVGRMGSYCKRALENQGLDFAVFDFRESQYLRSPVGSFFKKGIKKIFPVPSQQIPFVDPLERVKMNKSLLAKVQEYQPDILFVLIGETIFPQTLEKIKKSGALIANWFADRILEPGRKKLAQEISPYYDYFFLGPSEEVLGYVKIGAGYVKTMPLACNPEVHKRIDLTKEEKKRYGSEVCFEGTIKLGRERILSSLSDFDLAIWGFELKKDSPLAKFYRGKCFSDEEIVKIYNASDIVLDINTPYEGVNKVFHFTLRPFVAPACGTFVLTAENPHLANLYEIGKEIICYKDEKELLELVKYYLNHPDERRMIAQKGQQRALRDHTYEKRIKEMLAIIEKG